MNTRGSNVDEIAEGAQALRGEVHEGTKGADEPVATAGKTGRAGARDWRGSARGSRGVRAAVAVAIGLLLLGLGACSPINHGTITGKSASPGHFYTTTSCHPVGKTTVCTPSTYWQGPTWRLDLRDGETTGWVHVSEGEYDSYRVGEVYP